MTYCIQEILRTSDENKYDILYKGDTKGFESLITVAQSYLKLYYINVNMRVPGYKDIPINKNVFNKRGFRRSPLMYSTYTELLYFYH